MDWGQYRDLRGPKSVWVISYVSMRAPSLYRAYAADRGAAQLTGRPATLASALRTVPGTMDRVPRECLREQAEMTAFCILPTRPGLSTNTPGAIHRSRDVSGDCERSNERSKHHELGDIDGLAAGGSIA